MVPLHTWLPDAHSQAPTAGSVDLAGILLKTAAYGMLRFALPLFPNASAQFAPIAMSLGVLGILYGAFLCFSQNDIKRLVAYSSVSRSEEHTSELQSLMRISYAVFCLKKKKIYTSHTSIIQILQTNSQLH